MTKKQGTGARYITPHGEPVHSGFLRKAFHNAQIRASVLTTGAAVAAQIALGHDVLIPFTLVAGLALPALYAHVNRGSAADISRTFGGLDFSKISIDTRPDFTTPPMSPKTVLKTERTRDHIQWMAYAEGGLAALLVIPTLYISGEVYKVSGSFFAPFMMPIYLGILNGFCLMPASEIQIARRMNKVLNEEWSIIETPPPKKREQKTFSLNPFAKPA